MTAAAFGLALAPWPASPARADTPHLLFRADFDSDGGSPSFATGERGRCARSQDAKPGLGGRGGALLLGGADECSFGVAGNLDLRHGTLSFWAAPESWSDGEGRSQTFFDVSGVADNRPFRMYVDSPPEPGVVRLVIAWGFDPHQQLFQIYAPVEWRAGVWRKVDITWDEREIVIYADGRPGERLPLHTVKLPALPDGRFRLTPGPGPLRGSSDATRLDELEIWSGPLPADRITKRLLAEQAAPLAVARLQVPLVATPPHVDGRLDDEAWTRATRLPLLADAETGFSGLLVPHTAFAWSATALHVSFEAPLTAPTDAFELGVVPTAGGVGRTFRVTPRGLAGEDAVSSRVDVAAQAGADAWSAELSLPLADLGVDAREGTSLRLDVRHLPADGGALGVGGRLAGAEATLGDASDGVRITGRPELVLGHVALDFERREGGEAQVSLTRGERQTWRKRVTWRDHAELREKLDTPDGVLRIAALGERGRELAALETRLAPFEPPGMRPLPELEQGRLDVELDFGWLDGGWRRALAAGRAEARIADRGPKGVEGPLSVALENGRARPSFTAGLAPGRHRLALELTRAGEPLTLEREVEVPELPWRGTKVGVTEGVLDPWLPLGWDDDDSVRVWGRHYRFDGPLLAAVEGRGGPMLRGPVQLRARTAAGEAVLRTTHAAWSSRSAARAEAEGTAELSAAGIDVRWSAWIEYDGLVFTTLTLVPRQPHLRVDALELEIPLQSRIARYLRGTTLRSTIHSGRVDWDGRRFAGSFEPFVWLTNEEEGFLWFAESDANWVGSNRNDALVVQGGADAGIRLKLIGEPVVLPGPITYSFGFQATPVKPELKDARSWNFAEGGIPTAHERAVAYFARYAVADGLWKLQRPTAVQNFDQQMVRRGVRLFYFGTTGATPDADPTFRLFEPLWRSAWAVSYPVDADAASLARDAVPRQRLAAVCPAVPSFQDRMLYDAGQLLKVVRGLGLYTDTDEVFADDDPSHGCGFHDAFGRSGVSWTILSKRRFAKRLAAVVRSVGGERRYWMSHAHSRLVPPVHGFADFFYPGEELTAAVGSRPWFYMDDLDETAWHVEYRGESSGVVHVFLPEFLRGSGKREEILGPQPTESMLAMAAVNDVNVSSAWTNPEAVGNYWGLRERLGLVNAEFVGHWRPDCPVHALEADGLASLYRTRKGAVLVVTNRSSASRTVGVKLDPGALGLSSDFRARDERSGQLLSVQGDRIAVPLEPRTYTYVSLLGH